MTDSVTEYVEGEGSGYVVRVERLDPDEAPDLERVGFHSATLLYVVMVAGGEIYADHDRHGLVRSLPGSNDWLHDDLSRLADSLDAE